MLAVLAVMAALTAGAVVLSASKPASKTIRTAASVPRLKRFSAPELQQLLQHPGTGSLAPPADVAPGARPCFVQSARCSETPCLIFVQSADNGAFEQAMSARARTVITGRSTCPGGRTAPRTLRISQPAVLRVSPP